MSRRIFEPQALSHVPAQTWLRLRLFGCSCEQENTTSTVSLFSVQTGKWEQGLSCPDEFAIICTLLPWGDVQPVLVRSISQSPSQRSSVPCAARWAVLTAVGDLLVVVHQQWGQRWGLYMCVFWGHVCDCVWILTLIYIERHFPPLGGCEVPPTMGCRGTVHPKHVKNVLWWFAGQRLSKTEETRVNV